MYKKIIKVLLLFLLFMFLDLNAKSLETVSLHLQWKHQFEFAGFYAAKEKGYYKDAGLDVLFIEFDKEKDITAEVIKGNVEYGLAHSFIIAEYLNDKEILLIANFFKQSPLVIVAQDYIASPADLKNKKVMGLSDTINDIAIIDMLDKFGVDYTDIINISTSFSVDDFIDKKIDAMRALRTSEIYYLNKNGIKYNVFDPVVYGVKYYDLNLFTSTQEMREHPKRVKAFKEASILGWEYALKHKEELVEIILKKYNSQNKSREVLLFEANQIEQIMQPDMYKVGSIDINRIKIIADDFIQSGFVKKESFKSLEKIMYDYKTNPRSLKKDEQQFTSSYLNFDDNLLWQMAIVILFAALFIIYRQHNIKKINRELHRRVQEELKKSTDKDKMISHQNKLIAMGEMIENIAHQWRQPLSQVNSAVLIIDDIMYEDNYRSAEIEEKLLEIESLTKYMSNTIDDFKNFFDSNKEKQSFIINDVVDKSLSILKGTCDSRGVELEFDTYFTYKYCGYPSELQQVLVVILNNAIDVLTTREVKNAKIIIKIDKIDNYYHLTIEDNAGGIDADIINKIFEPYFTTKHKKQATGLGLYMARMIIEDSLGGHLECKNINDGAEFIIKLKAGIPC